MLLLFFQYRILNMKKAVKIRIYPTKQQKEKMSQHFTANRFIYNYMLAKKEKSYKEDNKKISCFDQVKELTLLKKEEKYLWLKDIDSQSLQQTIRNLDTAFKNFFRRIKKGSPASELGYPRFKPWYFARQSFQYPQRVKINEEKNKIYLPKIGWVKAMIHRDIKTIKTVTVSREAGQYHASILTEFPEINQINKGSRIALDMGVKTFATASNDNDILLPDIADEEKKIKLLDKALSRKKHSRKKGEKIEVSNKYKKLLLKKQKIYLKIKNIKKNVTHKQTLQIVKDCQYVFIEDLKIKNMTKSAKGNEEVHGKNVKQKSGLNRSIQRQSWGDFFTILEYKLKERNGELIRINPKNTSRECSQYGYIDKENRESQSIFKCKSCNYCENADRNASYNILKRGNILLLELGNQAQLKNAPVSAIV